MPQVTHRHILMALIGAWLGVMLASPAIARLAAELDRVSRQEIQERIAPVGSVCEPGQACANGVATVAAAGEGEPRTGEQVYSRFCATCHTTGLLGAPKNGDNITWTTRLKEVGGFATLLNHAIHGIKSMPPKGTCMDCSDQELSDAIEYMSGLKP